MLFVHSVNFCRFSFFFLTCRTPLWVSVFLSHTHARTQARTHAHTQPSGLSCQCPSLSLDLCFIPCSPSHPFTHFTHKLSVPPSPPPPPRSPASPPPPPKKRMPLCTYLIISQYVNQSVNQSDVLPAGWVAKHTAKQSVASPSSCGLARARVNSELLCPFVNWKAKRLPTSCPTRRLQPNLQTRTQLARAFGTEAIDQYAVSESVWNRNCRPLRS